MPCGATQGSSMHRELSTRPLPPSHPTAAPYLQSPGQGTASSSPLLSESVCTDGCYRREGAPPPSPWPLWAGFCPLSTPSLLCICSQTTPAPPWLCSLNAPVHFWLCLPSQGSLGVALSPPQIWQSQRFQAASTKAQCQGKPHPQTCAVPQDTHSATPWHLVSMAVFGSCQGTGGSNPGI